MSAMSPDMSRGTTKIVLEPIYHYGARQSPTRRTWAAFLSKRDETAREFCGHAHGHRTQEAATACAMKMWKRLPA